MSSRGVGVLMAAGCGVLVLLWCSSPWLLLPVVGAAVLVAVILFRPRGSLGAFQSRPFAAGSDDLPPTDFPTAPWQESRPGQFTTKVSEALLPSSQEDYFFRFSATVVWELEKEDPNSGAFFPEALAVEDVLKRAKKLTSERDPEDVSMLQYELAAELAVMRPDVHGRVRSMARSVTMTLSEEDRELLARATELRKKQALWHHRTDAEHQLREYLGEDVLKDKGRAVVWWMARTNGDLDKTLGQLDDLERLTAAVNGSGQADPAGPQGPLPFAVPVHPLQHLSSWVDSFGFSPEQREVFLKEHLDCILACNRPDRAKEVAEFFGIELHDPDDTFSEPAEHAPRTAPDLPEEEGEESGYVPRHR